MLISTRNKKTTKYETPIADFLIANSTNLETNFHALPIFHMKKGMQCYERYASVFGSKLLSLETTITGKLFDSFFYPTKEIKKAQRLAAETFGSNDTLFVTCGTSIANRIAVDALINSCSRVLLDRESHQSMHFAVTSHKVDFDYFYSEFYCNDTDRKYIKIKELLDLVTHAKNNNNPYDLIIINAASYDGVICNVYELIKRIIEIAPNTKFLVDEAWSSAFYFHPELYKFTAGYAAKRLKNRVSIVATQSAHKSLMALRQASFIHSFANDDITQKLYKSRFKYHSTSPSYPILASLDMARAQMQSTGKKLVTKALENSNILKEKLKENVCLNKYLLKDKEISLEKISDGICFEDPLKVHLNIEHLGTNGSEFQSLLYDDFGIYFNRQTNTNILINIHIGITQEHILHLISSLKKISILEKTNEFSLISDDDFIISYPPGIPLHVPGEIVNKQIHSEIKDKIKNGINVFHLS